MNYVDVVIRLCLAVVIGGVIGYEREYKNRPAGFRTHILVCIGATVIAMIQLYMVSYTKNMIIQNPVLASAMKADIGRVCAQVVSGIGFLGAGTIIHDKGSVTGLTTAASIWAVGCIGLAIGLGYYFLSAVSGITVYAVLVGLKRVENRLLEKNNVLKLEFEYYEKEEFSKAISKYISDKHIKVRNIEFNLENDNVCEYTFVLPKFIKPTTVIDELSFYDEIARITVM